MLERGIAQSVMNVAIPRVYSPLFKRLYYSSSLSMELAMQVIGKGLFLQIARLHFELFCYYSLCGFCHAGNLQLWKKIIVSLSKGFSSSLLRVGLAMQQSMGCASSPMVHNPRS